MTLIPKDVIIWLMPPRYSALLQNHLEIPADTLAYNFSGIIVGYRAARIQIGTNQYSAGRYKKSFGAFERRTIIALLADSYYFVCVRVIQKALCTRIELKRHFLLLRRVAVIAPVRHIDKKPLPVYIFREQIIIVFKSR